MTLTKKEAMQLLKQGHKITHKHFCHDEYIYLKNKKVHTEEGYNVGGLTSKFMTIRSGSMWNEGWNIYEK